jgi:hypothetical protein
VVAPIRMVALTPPSPCGAHRSGRLNQLEGHLNRKAPKHIGAEVVLPGSIVLDSRHLFCRNPRPAVGPKTRRPLRLPEPLSEERTRQRRCHGQRHGFFTRTLLPRTSPATMRCSPPPRIVDIRPDFAELPCRVKPVRSADEPRGTINRRLDPVTARSTWMTGDAMIASV